jgi:hypothetical protein
MPRKLFIVAKGNETVYRQLRRSVGREPGVIIIYDRRRTPKALGRLRRALSRVRVLLVGTPRQRKRAALRRRQREDIAEQIERQGWAVVHLRDSGDA